VLLPLAHPGLGQPELLLLLVAAAVTGNHQRERCQGRLRVAPHQQQKALLLPLLL
jgi:hypothetical protein